MMEITIKIAALILAGIAILMWQQPQSLFAAAGLVERLSGRFVRLLRIRAAAKQDGIDAYNRALIWHRANAA